MKMHLVMFVLVVFFGVACDRNIEGKHGYREEQEEVMKPNDYTTGEDVKERRQTGGEKRLPLDD